MTTIAERVEAGAAWLDANRPGWVWRIDLDTLDLGNPCRCVLGQEFREETEPRDILSGYSAGRRVFDGDYGGDTHDGWRRLTGAAAECGFHALADVTGGDTNSEYYELTAAWRDLIVQRRSLGDRTGDEVEREKRDADQ